LNKLRIAIVGAGHFARTCHIPGIRSHGGAEVVAICGRNKERTKLFAEQEQIPQSFDDLSTMLDEVECDAVTIASPDVLHFEHAMKVLEKGKHVFCEKPLAMNTEQARTMADAAKKAGVVNMVAFTFRYLQSMQKMRQLIREGAIGRPFHLDMQLYWGDYLMPTALTWRDLSNQSAAGIWADAGAHLLDASSYLFAPVNQVLARMQIVQREPGFAQTETVDMFDCLASTEFFHKRESTPVSVSMKVTRLTRPRGPIFNLHVIGSKGSLALPLEPRRIDSLSILPANAADWQDVPLETAQHPTLSRMLHSFVDAVSRGSVNKGQDAEFIDGLNAQCALDAGLKSENSKKFEDVQYLAMAEMEAK
jgi:predicted dehydrogenase